MQFITAFVIRNRNRAIKLKIAITVCVRSKKSIFLYTTVSQIVRVTDIIHLLSVKSHTTSTRTYGIISAAAQKAQNLTQTHAVQAHVLLVPLCRNVCTVRNRYRVSTAVKLRSDSLLY